MRRVTYNDYLEYLKHSRAVYVENRELRLDPPKIKRLYPEPDEFIDPKRGVDVTTTVWSFPKRGAWAVHRGNYRGNWAPQIPHILIKKYTEPGDLVLDPMIGSGTTCIEAKLLGRNCIGVDINYNSLILALHRLYHLEKYIKNNKEKLSEELEEKNIGISMDNVLRAEIQLYHGDARDLSLINNDSVDLVATHPPYYNIIKYSKKHRVEGDLSSYRELEEYMKNMRIILNEIFRVLRPGGYLGILVGDTRTKKHYVPITHHVLDAIMDTGFILREEVVKIQHKMKTTMEVWKKIRNRDYLLIYHEKLFIARKPAEPGEYEKYRYSSKILFK